MSDFKLAWRNIWRNRRRTIITASAVGLGLASILCSLAYSVGLERHMVETLTRSSSGQAQIHAVGYRQTGEAERVIPDPEAALAAAARLNRFRAASPRVLGDGLAAMGDRSASIRVMGIDFELERKVTNWPERLIKGTFPQRNDEILVGRKLAEKLELTVGGRVVVTVARIHDGELESFLARISGLIHTGNPALDNRTIIGSLATISKALGTGGAVHEIALKFDLPGTDRPGLAAIGAGFNQAGLEFSTWAELVPVLANLFDIQGVYLGVAVAIVFGLVSFGIINTMSMSLLERFREFGIMRAIGTSPLRMGRLIVIEATWLGLVGSLLGTLLSIGITVILGVTGINLGQVEVMGVNFVSKVYPVIIPLDWLLVAILFTILTPVVALGPAIKAGRIDIARALRRD